jgi:uncharacterized protein YlxW (UPF0749 family)
VHQLRSQLTIAAVALVLGVLVVVQLRGQQEASALAGLSAQELTVLVGNLDAHNEQLRKEVAGLEAQQADIATAQARGDTSVDGIRRDLARVRAWAGLDPVAGEGVTITVSGRIAGPGVEDLVNELLTAGAEALAVEDVRVVPGSVVAGPPGGLSIENTPLSDPFDIRAIGSKEALTGSLTRIGGIVAQLSATYPSVVVTVTPVDTLVLPPTTNSLQPTYGTPRL